MDLSADELEAELVRVKNRLDRERKARSDAETIAEQAMRALHSANQGLEDRVADRVEELRKANFKYKSEIEKRKQAEVTLLLRTQELEALFKIASILNQPMTFDEKANQVLEELLRISQVDRVTLRVSDEEIQGLRLVSSAGRADMGNPEYVPFDQRGISGLAFQRGNPVVVNDYASHPLAQPSGVQEGLGSMVSLPIIAGSQTLGVINIAAREPHRFPPEVVKLLAAIGEQLGGLLENARLSEQLQASTEEMDVVDEVARIITSTLDIDQVYEQFATEMRKLVDFDRTGIYSVDRDAGTIEFQYLSGAILPGRYTGDLMPLSGTETEIVIASGETAVREDVRSDPVFPIDPDLISAGLRSSIKVPLVAKGAVVGVLSLYSCQVGAYGPREQAVLERLASQIAPAIENAQIYQQLQASIEEMAVVDEVARVITSTLDIDQVYQRFATEVKKLVDFDCARISIIDSDNNELKFTHVSGQAGSFPAGTSVPLEGTVSSTVIKTRHSLVLDDLAEDTQYRSSKQLLEDGLRSAIAAPLICNDRVIATLVLLSQAPNTYGAREQRILERLAAQIAPAVENARLYEASNQMAQVFESIGDAVSVVDRSGNLLFVSKGWEVMFGYSADDVLGKPFFFVVPPDPEIQAQTRANFEQNFGQRWNGEVKRVRKDGEEFHVNLTRAPVTNQKGELVGTVAVHQDITERKQAEEVLRLRTEELEALFNIASTLAQPGTFEERYKGVLEELARVSETQAIILRVPDEEKQGLRLVAAAGWEIIAVRPSKLIPYGQSISGQTFQTGEPFISNDYPSDPRAIPAIVEKGVKSAAALPIKSGGEVLAVVILTSLEAGHFTPKRVRLLTAIGDGLGVLMENARLQEEITLGQELEQRRDAFVSVASHELRTPMTTILGFSELLLRRDPPEATRREWVERIHSHCGRLAGIVDDLLNVSRIQSGKLAVNPERLPLPVVVEEAVEAVRSTTDIHEFMLDIPPDTPKVVADPDKLAQVLTNLLTNAIKYSPSGGKITVSARLEAEKDRVVVTVADQGIGISRQDRENLFTTFHRIRRPETDGIGGSGLGLYIVKELVELMQGQVWLKSQLGKGSDFSFSIPTKRHKSRTSGVVFDSNGGKHD